MGTSVLTPTFRYHPSIVAQAFGTLGAMFPGRVILGIGTGEGLNEVPSTGVAVARVQGALRPPARGGHADPQAVDARSASPSRASTTRPRRPRSTTGPTSEMPIYVAAAGAVVARYAGRVGDGFICTSGKSADLYTETLMPSVEEGVGKAAATPKQHRTTA